MFAKYSMTGTGLLIFIVSGVSDHFGLNLDQGQVTEVALDMVNLFGLLLTLGGQIMREDLSYGLRRKEPLE